MRKITFLLIFSIPIYAISPREISNIEELSFTTRDQAGENRVLRQEADMVRLHGGLQQYFANQYVKDFFNAAITDNVAMLKARLKGNRDNAPINVNLEDTMERTALMLAAVSGSIHSIKVLLKTPDIIVNAQDFLIGTALMWAVSGGRKDVVKILLNDQRVDIDARNEDGHTALSIAIERGYTEIADMLRAAGATELQ